MRTPGYATALLGLFLMFNVHAAGKSSGMIRFSGAVYTPASASAAITVPDTASTTLSANTYALHNAQRVLPCSMLDYFATYAAKDAKLVSVSYN